MQKPAAPKILECTLRDGSYAIDFRFSAGEANRIARRRDDLGFSMIEPQSKAISARMPAYGARIRKEYFGEEQK